MCDPPKTGACIMLFSVYIYIYMYIYMYVYVYVYVYVCMYSFIPAECAKTNTAGWKVLTSELRPSRAAPQNIDAHRPV